MLLSCLISFIVRSNILTFKCHISVILSLVCYVLIINLMFYSVVDDAVKTENDSSAEITIKAESESDPCKMDGICPEVIKVYIFKADPGEDDLGMAFFYHFKTIGSS